MNIVKRLARNTFMHNWQYSNAAVLFFFLLFHMIITGKPGWNCSETLSLWNHDAHINAILSAVLDLWPQTVLQLMRNGMYFRPYFDFFVSFGCTEMYVLLSMQEININLTF